LRTRVYKVLTERFKGEHKYCIDQEMLLQQPSYVKYPHFFGFENFQLVNTHRSRYIQSVSHFISWCSISNWHSYSRNEPYELL